MWALLLMACGSTEKRVVLEINGVPTATTSLDALITAQDREVKRTFMGAELAQVLGGRTSVALVVDQDDSGPIVAQVQASASGCVIAEKSVTCDRVASCPTINVALEAVMVCQGDGGALDMAGVDAAAGDGVRCGAATCAGATPICCRAAPGSAAECSADVTCSGRVPVSCDGPNDCALGAACCASGDRVSCVGGGCGGDHLVCGAAADCPPAAPNCCPLRFGLKACTATPC
jgi:hypothetical protein